MPLRWSPCFKRAKSVYQRVVTHPGARLFAGPEDKAEILRDPLATFTVMYIYMIDRGDRLKVGTSSDKPDGWVNKG